MSDPVRAVTRTVPEAHHDHRDVTGGWLRPAVFGAMDGLVSNVALITGVAGAGVSAQTVGLTGLAGLVAGAFSMAVGEYTSVASQTELTRAEIEIERQEIGRNPTAEQAELAGLYRHRGLSPALADEVARQFSADPEQAWRIHAREELGVDPDALASPLVAAAASFTTFALGALLPLLPYFFGTTSLVPSLVLGALGLVAAGALVSRFTRRSWYATAARQLLLGAAAAAVTYGIGHAVGSGLGAGV